MVDNNINNSFKQVYDILQYTDINLINKIPTKFIEFLKENMNVKYNSNINADLDIDKQPLLKESEAIIYLIYKSYWATDDEKIDLDNKYRMELLQNNEKKDIKIKNINEIFEHRNNRNKRNNNLIVIPKQSLLIKIFNKIKRISMRFLNIKKD